LTGVSPNGAGKEGYGRKHLWKQYMGRCGAAPRQPQEQRQAQQHTVECQVWAASSKSRGFGCSSLCQPTHIFLSLAAGEAPQTSNHTGSREGELGMGRAKDRRVDLRRITGSCPLPSACSSRVVRGCAQCALELAARKGTDKEEMNCLLLLPAVHVVHGAACPVMAARMQTAMQRTYTRSTRHSSKQHMQYRQY